MIDGTLAGLLKAARLTVENPRGGARAVMSMGLPMAVRWMAFGLAVSGSTLLTIIAIRLSPSGAEPNVQQVLANPLVLSLMQGVVMLMAVQLIARVGQMAGGMGGFADALLLVTWLQIILMLVQIVQIAIELVAPMAAEVLGLFALGLMFWLLTHFVAELHGFTSLGAVFAGILGTAIAASFAMALLLLAIVGA